MLKQPLSQKQAKIIDAIKHLAANTDKVTFTLVRKLPGCSPNALKTSFGKEAESSKLNLYAFIWQLAGLEYAQHTARKPNNHWNQPSTRIVAIKKAVKALSNERKIDEIQMARIIQKRDFTAAGLSGLLAGYYDSSPERAVREAYDIKSRCIRNEFPTWQKVLQHLQEHLESKNSQALTEEVFLKTIPGGHTILENWGGFVEVMDRSKIRPFDAFKHTAPSNYWESSENRIRWVHKLVEAYRSETQKPDLLPNSTYFRENGLAGLLASTRIAHSELLREAGYSPRKRSDWSSKEYRTSRIIEIVEDAGGLEMCSKELFNKKAAGVIDHFVAKLGKRVERGNTPLVYEILRDAGYDVSPNDFDFRLGGWVESKHGDMNRSKWEAIMDDWVYEILGDRHLHEEDYPGQPQKCRHLNCDFVLLAPNSNDCKQGLWLEFAGLKGKKDSIGKDYDRRLKRKKALALKEGILLVIVSPDDFQKHPERVWQRMKKKAPWLESREAVALNCDQWKLLCKMPSASAAPYAMRNRKYTEQILLDSIRSRIAEFRRLPNQFPLNISACEKVDNFRKIFSTIMRISDRSKPDWWAHWLECAGMTGAEAKAVSRLNQRHGTSKKEVAQQLADLYKQGKHNNTLHKKEPSLNGALQLRAKKAFGTIGAAKRAAKKLLKAG